MKTQIQKHPFQVPTEDGKLIEEHFGLASLGGKRLSIARMEAPPFWEEPYQIPEFDEYTLIFLGQKKVDVDGRIFRLGPGESIFVPKGTRVRYSNPFDEPVIYCSICIPAFSPESVHRDQQS